MVNTLANKLFQFEIVKKGQYKEEFLFYLSGDIVEMLKKVNDKGLEFSLTPHERKMANEVKDYYNQYCKIFLKSAS